MSEETVQQEGGWSGLKKTLVGTLSTAILAGGTFITTKLFGGGESKEETKTEQAAAAPVINVNLENNNTNQQKQSGGTNTIIKERVIEKAAPATEKPAKKSETEEAPW
jgi:flagellar basal body-associated protein FliL